MRSWYVTCLLSIAIPLSAKTGLYEALKTTTLTPSPFTQQNETFETQLQDGNDFEAYQRRSMLKRLFPLYNVNLESDYVVHNINVNEEMSGEARALTEDTVYTQIALLVAVGVLVALPQSVSNWDLEELRKKSLGERWMEHVTTKPVWDEDDWVINYIGHPFFGAVYYTMARNDGLDIFESALFSTVMSTFFWEYGYEAFAEIPSIQDLIFTPLLGAFLGEGLHQLEIMLDANQGVIWGSKGLGSFSYFWLDPMGRIAGGLSETFDVTVTMEFSTFSHHDDFSQFRYTNDQAYPQRFQDRDYGVMLTFY